LHRDIRATLCHDHPEDPTFRSLKERLYSAQFLGAQDKYLGELAKELPDEVLDNKTLFLQLVSDDGYKIRWASERLRNDEELVRKALDNCNRSDCMNIFNYLPDKLLSNRRFMLDEARKGRGFISNLKGGLNDDTYLVLTELSKNHWNHDVSQYHAIGPRARNDPRVVEIIRDDWLKTNVYVDIESLPETLRADRNFMLTMVSRECGFLSIASPELKDDEEVVRTALRQATRCLQFASERLQKKLATEVHPQ
jgi:hypothetical protein